jgi:MFS family permease
MSDLLLVHRSAQALFWATPYIMLYFFDSYGIAEWQFGLVDTAAVIVFAVGAGVAEPLEKAIGTRSAYFIGFMVCAVSYALLAPTPLLSLTFPFWVTLVIYCTIFGGIAIPTIVASPALTKAAVAKGFSEEDACVQSATLTIFCTAIAMVFVLPSSSTLADVFGTAFANSCAAVLLLVVAIAQIAILPAVSSRYPSRTLV